MTSRVRDEEWHGFLPQVGEIELPVGEVAEAGLPADITRLMNNLFSTVLNGRNAQLSDGVQRALGRELRVFDDHARQVVVSGVWQVSA